MGVNGGTKKLVMHRKRRAIEEWLQRKIGLPRTDTGTKRGCETGTSSCKKNGDGESDWGIISRVTKRCFGKRYSE